MRRVKIKTCDEMAEIGKVGFGEIEIFNTVYTREMEDYMPIDRIIEIDDDGQWIESPYNHFTITYEMIKEDVPDSPTPMRSNVREGDRMWSVLTGWGIISVDNNEGNTFPVTHTPGKEDRNITNYTIDKSYYLKGEQALFFTPPTITQGMLEVPEMVVEKVVLTKKEISDKFGISLESLEIVG